MGKVKRINEAPNTYPGSGKLKCYICDEPYIDHAIGPCPELKGQRLTVKYGQMYHPGRKGGLSVK